MSKKLCLSAVVVALVVPVLVACGDDDGGPTLIDSGPRAETSVPTPPPTPPGTPPTPPGTPPTPPTPPGTPDGGREGGTPVPPTPLPPPPPPGGSCSAMVRTCIGGCMTNECAIACIEAEPACVMCLNESIFECAATMGCDDELATLNMCAETNMCMDQACIDRSCSMQFDAFIMCIPEACQMTALSECGVL